MAVTVERLIATLEARFDKYDKALNKALSNTDRTFTRIERRGKQLESRLASMGAGVGASLAKTLAVAGGIRGFQSLLDSATRIDNALKVAGLSGEELEKVYARLRESAIKNAAPLETLVTLYGRASLVQKELNVTQEEMLNFSDKIALALRVSGQSAAESSGALMQLSQALGSGVVRAEEFNSVLEGALPIAQAAAAGLKEAGGSVSKLRQLVVDGKISSQAFFRAFEAGSVILEDKVAGATLTTSQGLENIRTALIDAVRDFAKGSLAAEDLGQAFQSMAERINGVDFKEFGEQVRTAIEWIGELKKALSFVQEAGANFGAATGLDQFGVWLSEKTGLDIATDRAKERKGYWEKLAEQDIEARNEAYAEVFKDPTKYGPQLPAVELFSPGPSTRGGKRGSSATNLDPVSINDFAAPAKSGGRGGRKRADEYVRETAQIRDRIAALNAETAAQAGLNPLIDDYGYSTVRAKAAQDLLSAAQKAGTAAGKELKDVQQLLRGDFDGLSPAARKQAESMLQLATNYGVATEASERFQEKQEEIKKKAEDALNTAKDVVGGMIDGFVEGEKAADIFANSLKKIGKALVDDVLTNIFSIKNAGSGGWLDGILGLLGGGSTFTPTTTLGNFLQGIPGFASGTNSAPGGLALVGEKGPELVNLPRGAQVLPNNLLRAPTMPKLAPQGSGGQAITAPVSINIDATGADAAGLARLERQLASMKQELPATIVSTVRDAQKRRGL